MSLDLTAKGFSLANAKVCAAQSRLAYIAAPTLVDRGTDTQVLIRQTSVAADAPIIIAFRGTTDLRDFITDGKAWSAYTSCGEVHSGFLDAWGSIRRDVQEALLLFANRPLIITGHSLGGALAILCANALAGRGFNVHSVYTFGCPRVGDRTFCNGYDCALYARTFNVACQNDPVPLLPPLLFGYRDTGNEAFLTTRSFSGGEELQLNPGYGFELLRDLLGIFQSWRCGRLALLPNHAIDHYIAMLESIGCEDCDSPAGDQEPSIQASA